MPGKKELLDLVAAMARRAGPPPGDPPFMPSGPPDNAGRRPGTDDAGGQHKTP